MEVRTTISRNFPHFAGNVLNSTPYNIFGFVFDHDIGSCDPVDRKHFRGGRGYEIFVFMSVK